MTNVLVVGGIAHEVDISPDGIGTPRLAGSGLVAALVAARLGSRVALAGFVGSDDADALAELTHAFGIDATGVVVVEGASPQYVFGRVSGAAAVPHPAFRPSEALPEERPTMPAVVAVAVLFGIPGFDPLARGWLDRVSLRDATVLWDRQGWLSAARDGRRVGALPCARRVRLTSPEERQAEVDADEGLPGAGFDAAVVKRGPWGADLVTTSGIIPVPAFEVRALRVIGACDAFAGALAASLADGIGFQSAAVRASAVAGCMIADGGIVPPGDLAERSAVLAETGAMRWTAPERLAVIVGEVTANARSLGARLIAHEVEGRLRALGIRCERRVGDSHKVVVRVREREAVLGTWDIDPADEPEEWLERLAHSITQLITTASG